MSKTTRKLTVTTELTPEDTVTLDYEQYSQDDFVTGQEATIELYTRDFDLAPTFGGSEITFTWPADAPYNLPVGEYYIDLDLKGGGALPTDVGQASNVADSTAISDVTDSTGGTAGDTLAAVTDTSATDQSGPVNNNFASLLAKNAELETKLNDALGALKDSGLMEADA